MILLGTIHFQEQLKANNNREWFQANRAEYEAARNNFFEFVGSLIAGIRAFDPTLGSPEAKDCTFRINRDIRFSPNKEPYKTNMGAYMAHGGRKGPYAGYYFHLEPNASFISGGIYMASPANMKRIRVEIDTYPEEFLAIVNRPPFRSTFSVFDSESLKRIPQGFSADSPVAAFLKLKHLTPLRAVTNAELTSNLLLGNALEAFRKLQPLVAFLNRALSD